MQRQLTNFYKKVLVNTIKDKSKISFSLDKDLKKSIYRSSYKIVKDANKNISDKYNFKNKVNKTTVNILSDKITEDISNSQEAILEWIDKQDMDIGIVSSFAFKKIFKWARNYGKSQSHRISEALAISQYQSNGIDLYIWRSVRDGSVRDRHRYLNGKKFRFSKPPISNLKTKERFNPGQDYGCRCFAEPIVTKEIKGSKSFNDYLDITLNEREDYRMQSRI